MARTRRRADVEAHLEVVETSDSLTGPIVQVTHDDTYLDLSVPAARTLADALNELITAEETR